jgi:hypothetical protein
MQLLTDENTPLATVRALRAPGDDVLSASEAMPRALTSHCGRRTARIRGADWRGVRGAARA